MKTDIEIAQSTQMQHIANIAKTAGVDEEYLEFYGKYKAKIDYRLLQESKAPNGKLILVTAINPTPAGEGKTTTTVGLADGMRRLGKNALVALREPSLGPVFGVKGGAAGGGYAQVVPMEDINLHFTGDFHAIGAANNLLAAMLDNHIQQGNALGIDVKRITWKRCVDMNDRQLRNVIDGLGGRMQGVPREDGFDITVASEVMAVLCLASSITDLKERLSRIIVGYTYDEKPVTAGDLKAAGAMAALLKDALKPNLVQTLEGTPAFIHGGPFANIAHGCNSVMATTQGRPYTWVMFSTWRRRLGRPRSRAARSSWFSSALAAPPWCFRARTVATSTTASGVRPAMRHLMSRNFSAPRSAAKPASVTV